MAAGGFLNLAYMAELGFVVNLAYLELKSLRYIERAREIANEVLLKLNDVREKRLPVVGSDEFMELYTQAQKFFHDDARERSGHWYVKDRTGNKERNDFCAYALWLFTADRDRYASTFLLVLTAITIVAITILSHFAELPWVVEREGEGFLWWALFSMVAASIAFPAAFIWLGRYIKAEADQIAIDIARRKDEIWSKIIVSLTGSSVRRPPPPGAYGPVRPPTVRNP